MSITNGENHPDFSEFMWMEDMEDFDREVEQRLQEEDAISMEWHWMMDEEEDFFEQMEQVREEELSSSVSSQRCLYNRQDITGLSLDHIGVKFDACLFGVRQ